MGMVVDEVEEVLNINAGDIQETPDFGVSVDISYILGMAMVKGKVKAILDIQKVVAAETIETAAEAGLAQ
jgi:purine-binding chemotaxis protein CheW